MCYSWAMDEEMERVPIPDRVAYRRKKDLEMCLRVRAGMARGYGFKRGRYLLRLMQKNLLKLRVWRATGRYPADN